MSLEKSTRFLKFSNIFAGLGMGLLLGIIMGLSVSPTVKVVMGTLTAGLGAFLGLDGSLSKKSGQSTENTAASSLAGLRAGSFGFAVVFGIISGMIIRTNELFAPSIKDRIEEWENAGFTNEEAKKFVLYQKLGIDPVTGEAGEIGDMQRSGMSSLFNSPDNKQLSELLDPGLWNNSIETALNEVERLEFPEVLTVFKDVQTMIPEENQFDFFGKLQLAVYQIETGKTNYCDLPDSMIEWQDNSLRDLGDVIASASPSDQPKLISNLRTLFCKLETTK